MELNLEAALGAADADEDASPAQASLAVLLATQSADVATLGQAANAADTLLRCFRHSRGR